MEIALLGGNPWLKHSSRDKVFSLQLFGANYCFCQDI